ncbi:MAG: hypothetical protein AB1650_04830 [Candidatus Omnitrophota bacterium]
MTGSSSVYTDFSKLNVPALWTGTSACRQEASPVYFGSLILLKRKHDPATALCRQAQEGSAGLAGPAWGCHVKKSSATKYGGDF